MTTRYTTRLGGLALILGAILYAAYLLARSVITAGNDPLLYSTSAPWLIASLFGTLGSAAILLGLPALAAHLSPSRLASAGLVLLAFAWLFLGPFLSLYGLLIAPWLAQRAPELMRATAPPPSGVLLAFAIALGAALLGSLLLGLPYLQRRTQPHWLGIALPAAALLMIAGTLLAPSGPAASLPLNLASNAGYLALMVTLGVFGYTLRRASVAA